MKKDTQPSRLGCVAGESVTLTPEYMKKDTQPSRLGRATSEAFSTAQPVLEVNDDFG
jgi:hypothetical protein